MAAALGAPPVAAAPPLSQSRCLPDLKVAAFRRSSNVPDDVVSWTASIKIPARRGDLSSAAATFSSMLESGATPNHVTFLTLLSSCADFAAASPLSFPLALSLHSLSLKLLPSHAVTGHVTTLLSTALADFYLKSNLPHHARKLFDEMPQKTSVSYNTMIAGLMHNKDVDGAFGIFHEMPNPDIISWTALIDGFVKNGFPDDALGCFREMLSEDIQPDYVLIVAVVSACADLGALEHGLWVHRYVVAKNPIRQNLKIANALIDMYSRCGRVDFAQQVFDGMRRRSLVSWNSMIVGFAANGRSSAALDLFDRMRREGFRPDGVTFTGVLSACSHAGLAHKGLHYFNLMRSEFGIVARMEHYGCVVDLLGRAGRLEEAIDVVKTMPMRPNEVVLGALLAACRVHGDVATAEKLMTSLLQLEPGEESSYVLLSNMYASIGKWDGVGEVRSLMKSQGVKKKPGFSAVEVNGHSHEFIAGDRSHPRASDIYKLLDLLSTEMENAAGSHDFSQPD